jgi:hypothetical protein
MGRVLLGGVVGLHWSIPEIVGANGDLVFPKVGALGQDVPMRQTSAPRHKGLLPPCESAP